MLIGLPSLSRFVLCCGLILTIPVFSVVAADPPKGAAKPAAKAGEKADEHEHPEVGPHKGALIELGDEEYHAEILFDEDEHIVTVYLLDSAAKETVTSDAKDIAVNLKHKGKGVQFKLKAQPQKSDPAGTSSRYSAKNNDLMHAILEKDAKPQLRLAIKGKTYSGKIDPHGHDHDHEHEEKDTKKTEKK